MGWNKVGNIGAGVNALYPTKVNTAATGSATGVAIGNMANASGENAIALGTGAVASAEGAVAFGTTNATANTIDIANRRITNCGEGTDDNDAVNLQQLRGLLFIANYSVMFEQTVMVPAGGTTNTVSFTVSNLYTDMPDSSGYQVTPMLTVPQVQLLVNGVDSTYDKGIGATVEFERANESPYTVQKINVKVTNGTAANLPITIRPFVMINYGINRNTGE